MLFSPIDDSLYDTSAIQITYCKLFPLILEDFVTRKDATEMMKSSNLPVSTDVVVTPGQGVSVAVPAGTGSTVTPGKGNGSGNAKPIYNGAHTLPADEVLAKEKEAIKNAGGQTTKAITDTALGK